jgi:hypothetical protein
VRISAPPCRAKAGLAEPALGGADRTTLTGDQARSAVQVAQARAAKLAQRVADLKAELAQAQQLAADRRVGTDLRVGPRRF